jgi:hypothetical protein
MKYLLIKNIIKRMFSGKLFVLSYALIVIGLIIAGFKGHVWAMWTAGILGIAPIIIIALDRWKNPEKYSIKGILSPYNVDNPAAHSVLLYWLFFDEDEDDNSNF